MEQGWLKLEEIGIDYERFLASCASVKKNLFNLDFVKDIIQSSQATVTSRLADTPLLRIPAITDKIQPSPKSYRGLTANDFAIADSRYYGLQTTSQGCPL